MATKNDDGIDRMIDSAIESETSHSETRKPRTAEISSRRPKKAAGKKAPKSKKRSQRRAAAVPHEPREDIVAAAAARAAEPVKTFAMLTYIPSEGDLPYVDWAGLRFHAHIPLKVPLTQGIHVPIRKEIVDEKTGQVFSQMIDMKLSIVELAKGNCRFAVDGVMPKNDLFSVKMPTDSDEYRGFALKWIAQSVTPEQVQQIELRWQAEEGLRDTCNVEIKDLAYLQAVVDGKLGRKAARSNAVDAIASR
jgi:hypothetical protein